MEEDDVVVGFREEAVLFTQALKFLDQAHGNINEVSEKLRRDKRAFDTMTHEHLTLVTALLEPEVNSQFMISASGRNYGMQIPQNIIRSLVEGRIKELELQIAERLEAIRGWNAISEMFYKTFEEAFLNNNPNFKPETLKVEDTNLPIPGDDIPF